jgi:hypothetical protein
MEARTVRQLTLISAALIAACGSELESAAPGSDAPVQVAGEYHVRGTTAVVGSDESREISGHVILAQQGDAYTATFSLETLYPAPGGAVPAEVVGNGEGKIVGRILEGTAETQIVASRVPGLDSRFAMVPPAVSVRIVSDTSGRIHRDGRLTIKIESRGAEGERNYVPTRTSLHGGRVASGSAARSGS